MIEKKDRYRPNHVIGTLLVAAFLLLLLLGQSLWIPVSKIGNLHVRSIALSIADAGSFVSSSVGIDTILPDVRSRFLSVSGLSENPSWDTRYFNRRGSAETVSSGFPVAPAAQAAPAIPSAPSPAVPSPETGHGPDVTGALAGTATPALAVNRSSLSTIHSGENPLSVFMFGDSQVFSLGSGLSRLAGKDSPIKIDFLAIHSSGVIRDDYYNWPLKLQDTLASTRCDAVVMMLGMNDYQSFRGSQGEILRKKTPEWEAAYKEKCRALIDIALVSVPRVYWIGMPVVKNPAYRESLSYIDSVQKSLADEYSPDVLVRVSLSDIIPGAGKPWVGSIDRGGGNMLQVMSSDGSHFTVEGGMIVMQGLFDRLARDFLFTDVPVAQKLE
jgi:uncharacterized protein